MCNGDRLRVAQIFGIGRTGLYGYRSDHKDPAPVSTAAPPEHAVFDNPCVSLEGSYFFT